MNRKVRDYFLYFKLVSTIKMNRLGGKMFKRKLKKESPPLTPTFKTTQVVPVIASTDEETITKLIRSINALVVEMTSLDYVKDMVMGVKKQTEVLESIAAGSEELSSSVTEVADFVSESNQKTHEAIDLSDDFIGNVGETFDQIIDAFKQTQKAAESIDKLSEGAEKIEQMVTVIKSVAAQTNLLALNASIEAARAGDAGRGFGVVAEEIKKLADSTKEQADIIQGVVNDLREGTLYTVSLVESATQTFLTGRDKMEVSKVKMNDMQASLHEVGESFEKVHQSIDAQTAVTEEMASNLMVVNEEVKKLDDQSNRTGQEYNEICKALNQMRIETMDKILLDEADQLDLCMTDHLIWKWRVYNMIMGYENFKESDVGTHKTCRLGRWVEETGDKNPKYTSEIQRMEAPHKAVHDLAKEAIRLFNAGNVSGAEDKLSQMNIQSQKVMQCLDRIKKIN